MLFKLIYLTHIILIAYTLLLFCLTYSEYVYNKCQNYFFMSHKITWQQLFVYVADSWSSLCHYCAGSYIRDRVLVGTPTKGWASKQIQNITLKHTGFCGECMVSSCLVLCVTVSAGSCGNCEPEGNVDAGG